MAVKLDIQILFAAGLLLTLLCSDARANDLEEVRNTFKCDDCAFQKCPALIRPCELVREPGICSCCLTCARKEGENCGINLGRCGRGFQCRPEPDDPNPLLSLLVDTAICQRIVPKQLLYREMAQSRKRYEY